MPTILTEGDMQPLQQDLNGPQMGVDHTVGLTMGYSF